MLGYITFMFSPRKDTIYLVLTQNFLKKLEFLTPLLTCAYQGVRSVSFSEDFAYLINKLSQRK